MTDKISNILKILTLLLFVFSIGLNVFFLTKKDKIEEPIIKTVITEKIDTIYDKILVPKYETKIKTVRDTLVQSIADHDTVKVVVDIPITQKQYTNDSTYTAWVSGYKPQLDSIEVYNKTITVKEQTQIIKKPIITVSANVGAGYGIIHKQFDTFVGISVGVPLWNVYKTKKY